MLPNSQRNSTSSLGSFDITVQKLMRLLKDDLELADEDVKAFLEEMHNVRTKVWLTATRRYLLVQAPQIWVPQLKCTPLSTV